MQGGMVLTADQIAKSQATCNPQKPPLLAPPTASLANQSPEPIVSWMASSCTTGNPADAQIAVSSTRVIVTFESEIVWYDKQETSGESWPMLISSILY